MNLQQLSRPFPGLATPAELQEGIARLSRGAYFREASLDMALSIIAEAAARMSGVTRVSIRALSADGQELCCIESFSLASGRHVKGDCLQADDFPAYFAALRAESCIVADDVGCHPATMELARIYLTHERVSAVLDTPIHIRGELQGVLSFEQEEAPEPWAPEHRLFAHAIANLVTLALVEYEADEARRRADSAARRLQTLLPATATL